MGSRGRGDSPLCVGCPREAAPRLLPSGILARNPLAGHPVHCVRDFLGGGGGQKLFPNVESLVKVGGQVVIFPCFEADWCLRTLKCIYDSNSACGEILRAGGEAGIGAEKDKTGLVSSSAPDIPKASYGFVQT